MAPRKHPVEFFDDRPIPAAKADKLNRSKFATSLAERIRAWRGRDSLVVALCGEWGCGKTSLKNMVIERLRHGRRAGVDILEFNPWQFSGHDTLSASFFAELLHAVERDQPDNSASKQRAKKLRLYARLAVLGAGAMKFVGRATRSFGDDMAAPSALLETAAGAVENVGDSVTQAAEARKQLYLISL